MNPPAAGAVGLYVGAHDDCPVPGPAGVGGVAASTAAQPVGLAAGEVVD